MKGDAKAFPVGALRMGRSVCDLSALDEEQAWSALVDYGRLRLAGEKPPPEMKLEVSIDGQKVYPVDLGPMLTTGAGRHGDLKSALSRVFPPDQVALLTDGDVREIEAIVARAPRRRKEAEALAAWDASTLRLRWRFRAEARYPSGELLIVDRSPEWLATVAWLRIVTRDDGAEQWEARLCDRRTEGSDSEEIVFGPPSESRPDDFERHRATVESWVNARGYTIEAAT